MNHDSEGWGEISRGDRLQGKLGGRGCRRKRSWRSRRAGRGSKLRVGMINIQGGAVVKNVDLEEVVKEGDSGCLGIIREGCMGTQVQMWQVTIG